MKQGYRTHDYWSQRWTFSIILDSLRKEDLWNQHQAYSSSWHQQAQCFLEKSSMIRLSEDFEFKNTNCQALVGVAWCCGIVSLLSQTSVCSTKETRITNICLQNHHLLLNVSMSASSKTCSNKEIIQNTSKLPLERLVKNTRRLWNGFPRLPFQCISLTEL